MHLSDGDDATDGSNDANASRNDDAAAARDENGHDTARLRWTTLLTKLFFVKLPRLCSIDLFVFDFLKYR